MREELSAVEVANIPIGQAYPSIVAFIAVDRGLAPTAICSACPDGAFVRYRWVLPINKSVICISCMQSILDQQVLELT